MNYYSKKRKDGSVYHFPVNEYQKRQEKEITFHGGSGYTDAKKIAYRILNDYLNQIKMTEDMDYVQDLLEGIGISLSDQQLQELRKYITFSQKDYAEMTKLVQVHIEQGEDESEIENASDVRDWRDKVLNYAVLRAIEKYGKGGNKK